MSLLPGWGATARTEAPSQDGQATWLSGQLRGVPERTGLSGAARSQGLPGSGQDAVFLDCHQWTRQKPAKAAAQQKQTSHAPRPQGLRLCLPSCRSAVIVASSSWPWSMAILHPQSGTGPPSLLGSGTSRSHSRWKRRPRNSKANEHLQRHESVPCHTCSHPVIPGKSQEESAAQGREAHSI